jgi:hypothetical protein
VENLISLYEEEKIDIEFVKLIQLYHFLNRTRLTDIISKVYSVFESFLLKNLTGNYPNLFVLIGFEWAIYALPKKN